MKFDSSYGPSENFKVKKDNKKNVSIFDLGRPKSSYEMNHFLKTPYTERKCMNCRRVAGVHYYLPICDMKRLGQLFCRKDATNFFKELIK
jgi:hypothetical protein